MNAMIVAEDLTKHFRRYHRAPGLAGSLSTLFTREYDVIKAVDAVSFQIDRGSKTAYIGANGAGKSTTIKVLTGIMQPTAGSARVAGFDPAHQRSALAQRIGVVFGQRSQLWWDLPVQDSFRILRHLYEVPDTTYRRNMALFADILDLPALGTTPVRQLSLGQRIRAEIAACLLPDPEVIFLDEPTIGLDLVLKQAVRDLINQLNAELGTTVMLTTHDIGDITGICDRALVVDHGVVVHSGTVRELLRSVEKRAVIVELGSLVPAETAVTSVRTGLPGVDAVITDSGRLRVDYPTARYNSREVVGYLLEQFELTDITVPDADLESVLRRIYAGAGAGAQPAITDVPRAAAPPTDATPLGIQT